MQRQVWQKTKPFISILWKTAGALATVLTLVTSLGLGSLFLGAIQHILSLFILGLSVVIIVLIILMYTLFYKIYIYPPQKQPDSIDTKAYPPPPPEEVEILRKEIVYVHSPDGKTKIQRKRMLIQALQDNVTQFKDRYRWSGKGKCSIQSLTPACRISNQHSEDSWEYFDVQFPHPLHKDERVDFTIEWNLVDEENKAVDFLSTMIDRETRYLLLQVNLPPELAPKSAYRYEYANYIDTLPVVAQETQWNPATQSIIYEVLNPQKYHKYLIRWHR